MDLNDLITLLVFFAFFVLPSIFKGLGKKKKKTSPVRAKKKKASLIGRLGEALQEFKRELEQQAMEARRKAEAEKTGTAWDAMQEDDMAKEGIERIVPDTPPPLIPVEEKIPELYVPESFAGETASPVSVPAPAAAAISAPPDPCAGGLPQLKGRQPRHPLQQAVVWAEILGKPAALKND